jgi:hypothetical protein
MKIYVDNDPVLIPLRRHIELEGNQLVAAADADFLISNVLEPTVKQKALRGGTKLSQVIVQQLGYEATSSTTDFFVSRWRDQGLFGWGEQIFLGIPLVGVMNGGIGAAVPVGCVGMWVESRMLKEIFNREALGVLLREMNHSGFVSIHISSVDGRIGMIETGVPSWGLYNILENLPGPIEEWLVEPGQTRFRTSWTCGLLVSRFPYPLPVQNGDAIQVGGITDGLEKHFWFGSMNRFRNAIHTRENLIGVATGWSWRLGEACERATFNARAIGVREIQFRSDAEDVAGAIWGAVKQLGVLDNN